jgi:hypothetical protein
MFLWADCQNLTIKWRAEMRAPIDLSRRLCFGFNVCARVFVCLFVSVSLASFAGCKKGGEDPAKKKLAPSCESLLELKDRCVVGGKVLKGDESKFLEACKLAEKLPDVARQIQCVKDSDCGKFKACYKDDEASGARWKVIHQWAKEVAKDAVGGKHEARLELCKEHAEDKTGVMSLLCKPAMEELWPKLVSETQKKLDEMWDKPQSVIWGHHIEKLGKLVGKEKEAAPLQEAIDEMEQMTKARNEARLKNDPKFLGRLPVGCKVRAFEKYAQLKDPRVKKYVEAFARYCFVTLGAHVLENVAKDKGSCSSREDVTKGLEQFKLTDPRIDALLKKDAARCK